jgi:hypothetical protein
MEAETYSICDSITIVRTFSPFPYFVESISVCQNCFGKHTLSTQLSTHIHTGIPTLPCPTENLHWSSQVWSTIAIGLKIPNTLQQRGCLNYTSRNKVPSGRGRKTSCGLDSLKDEWGTVLYTCLPSSFLCPETQRNQCVGCRSSMVMKPK